MRTIDPGMDPVIVSAIDARLADLRLREEVSIPLAIESGSRAWGFPSPDSDYDCRFLYLRKKSAYLSLWPPRDVLETPLDKVFDVNGWDLAKALKLMVAGNATVTEWLASPIVYHCEERFHTALVELARQTFRPERLRRHYQHLGRRQFEGASCGEQVLLKRIFYALRPAFSLYWLRERGTPPPMDLPALMVGCEPGLAAEISELLAHKAKTRELGLGPLPPGIDRFVRRELTLAGDDEQPIGPPRAEVIAATDAFFNWAITEFAPSEA